MVALMTCLMQWDMFACMHVCVCVGGSGGTDLWSSTPSPTRLNVSVPCHSVTTCQSHGEGNVEHISATATHSLCTARSTLGDNKSWKEDATAPFNETLNNLTPTFKFDHTITSLFPCATWVFFIYFFKQTLPWFLTCPLRRMNVLVFEVVVCVLMLCLLIKAKCTCLVFQMSR